MKNKILIGLLLAGSLITSQLLPVNAQTTTTKYLNGKIISSTDTGNAAPKIYMMNSDGSDRVIVPGYGGSSCCSAWSPTGDKILFAADGDGDGEIYKANPDGSGRERLTNNLFLDSSPNWSWDGSKIAFTSLRDGNEEIYIMDADGSNETNISNGGDEYYGAWSPDGQKILYAKWPDDNGAAIGDDIYIMNADGTNETRLTNIVPSAGASYYYSLPLAGAWQPIPVPATVDNSGITRFTVGADKDYSISDYTVTNNEILTLNGKLGDVIIVSGGKLLGSGSATTLNVQSGGKVNPGNSPGCLSSGNLTLSGTYQAELGGNDPCTGYDQLKVSGAVNLTGGSLEASLVNNFVPQAGQTFTIIENDATDSITGTFNNLAEGATFTSGSVVYKISYLGGDGNDVVLTAVSVPASPNTGFMSGSSFSLVVLLVAGAGILLFAKRRIQQS